MHLNEKKISNEKIQCYISLTATQADMTNRANDSAWQMKIFPHISDGKGMSVMHPCYLQWGEVLKPCLLKML